MTIRGSQPKRDLLLRKVRRTCHVALAWGLLSAFFLVARPSGATTMTPVESTCPVCSGHVTTYGIMSYGGYIYRWKSKYDLVFWPNTTPKWVWSCPNCGYAQIGGDFFKLPAEKLPSMRKALAGVTPCGDGPEQVRCRLDRALLVNQVLERSPRFWVWFNRVLAYQYREIGDEADALAAEQREIDLLESGADSDLSTAMRHYILGEYYRRLGNTVRARAQLRYALATRYVPYGLLALAVIVLVAGLLLARRLHWSRRAKALLVVGAFAAATLLCWTAFKSWQNNSYLERIVSDRLELL